MTLLGDLVVSSSLILVSSSSTSVLKTACTYNFIRKSMQLHLKAFSVQPTSQPQLLYVFCVVSICDVGQTEFLLYSLLELHTLPNEQLPKSIPKHTRGIRLMNTFPFHRNCIGLAHTTFPCYWTWIYTREIDPKNRCVGLLVVKPLIYIIQAMFRDNAVQGYGVFHRESNGQHKTAL